MSKFKNRFDSLFETPSLSVLESVPDNLLSLTHFVEFGFEQVARVEIWVGNLWLYKDYDPELLYSTHSSWLYIIVVDGQVYKLGETGNPLGIKSKTHQQPKTGTSSRLGRLANHSSHGDTDYRLREELHSAVIAGQVEIWAYKCPIKQQSMRLANLDFDIQQTVHKDLEAKILTQLNQLGQLPPGNRCTK
jgi:hypothetical protein